MVLSCSTIKWIVCARQECPVLGHQEADLLCYFFFFTQKVIKYNSNFKLNSWSKYNPLSLTFLCINRQTQDFEAPVGSRGNYLEKAAMLQVEGGMLITSVDSQDDAALFSFVQSLHGLINYETMHR